MVLVYCGGSCGRCTGECIRDVEEKVDGKVEEKMGGNVEEKVDGKLGGDMRGFDATEEYSGMEYQVVLRYGNQPVEVAKYHLDLGRGLGVAVDEALQWVHDIFLGFALVDKCIGPSGDLLPSHYFAKGVFEGYRALPGLIRYFLPGRVLEARLVLDPRPGAMAPYVDSKQADVLVRQFLGLWRFLFQDDGMDADLVFARAKLIMPNVTEDDIIRGLFVHCGNRQFLEELAGVLGEPRITRVLGTEPSVFLDATKGSQTKGL